MKLNMLNRIGVLLILLLALGACGGGVDRDAWRNGATPGTTTCVFGTSTWGSGCTWGR